MQVTPKKDSVSLATVEVLLVEDNPVDARLLELLLGEAAYTQYRLSRVEQLSEALSRVRKEQFQVVLLDLSLPDSQGFETFQRLKAETVDVPIIILSGSDDETLAVRAVREGAQDYLVKGRIDGHVLSRAISYAMERHQSEKAQQESERHYKYLLESITDYTYSVKFDAGKPVNSTHGPGCEAVTGYKSEEYARDPQLWFRMVFEEDREAVLKQIEAIRAGQMPPPLEHRIWHKSGRIRWVRNTVLPWRNRKGSSGYDGLIADITERKTAEEKLVKSEAFYHSLVENLPQNILRKDLRERFTFANQRFCALLNKPLAEIIGKTDFDFYPAELAAKFQRDDRYVIETGDTFETVEENQSPSGEKIYVQVIKTPVVDDKQRIIGIQGIFWDITERKRWEERLQAANKELALSEAALRKSHEELKAAQMQLIQAEKMECIGTLAAGVAHEVKNPLAIILMGVNYLTKKVPDTTENVGTVLKEMKEAVSRADEITRGLLDFAATRQLAVEPVQLPELLDDSLRMIRHELAKRGIEVVRDYAKGLPEVAVDKRQIQQVFVNIFMNAAQAMQKGGKLTVRTYGQVFGEAAHFEGSRKADRIWKGDKVVIAEVEDTGEGIPEQYLTKIFDPFFTTKPTGVGTGLGLPVSRRIIELHGGSLEIQNVPGGGVRATIVLKAQRS